jgi:hypothetical protein
MKNKILLLIGIAPAMLFSCKPTPCADVLIKKDTTDALERKNNLFVFVGEKIDMKRFPVRNDSGNFNALYRYKILQRVYGCHPYDTIEFSGSFFGDWPEFTQLKNAMLYITKEDGGYYHHAYLYDDVYMTKSGKWAGPYEAADAAHYNELNISPGPMEFADSVIFPLKTLLWDGSRKDFLHPFYWTVGDKAIAQYGFDVENLFYVKKNGSLAKMGLFTRPEQHVQHMVQDIQLEEVAPDENLEEAQLKAFWKKFAKGMLQNDTTFIKKILSDSLWVCGTLFSKQKLMSGCFREIFDSTMLANFDENWFPGYSDIETELEKLLPSARKKIIKHKTGYWITQFAFSDADINGESVYTLFLSFIKTKNGYCLYDIRYPRNRSCCF